MHDEAVEALKEAFDAVGLPATEPPGLDGGADLVVQGPRGLLAVDSKSLALADCGRVQSLIDRYAQEPADPSESEIIRVLVADQLPDESRDLLKRHGWGYLDRRGEFWLRTSDLFINDTTIASSSRSRTETDAPIRGRVGLGAATWILMHPREELVTRQLARTLDASPSTVHEALKRLRDQALLDRAGRPLVPELFNAVANVWRPERVSVARPPEPDEDEILEMNLHDDGPGWVVSGTVAAAAAGAGVVVAEGAPPDFYVPSAGVLRRAIRRLGKADFVDRGATVALAPTTLVTDESHYVGSHYAPWLSWPIAHPVAIALDLAQDQSRGREILAEWTPEGFDRVW
jgi:hypothetical protein